MEVGIHFNGERSSFTHMSMNTAIAHQGNGFDCGCYTIWNMVRFIQNLPFVQIPLHFREKVALWLLSQDHSVFFNDYIPMMDVITIIDD